MTPSDTEGPQAASSETVVLIEDYYDVWPRPSRLPALVAGASIAAALAVAFVAGIALVTGRRLDWLLLGLGLVSLALSLTGYALWRRSQVPDVAPAGAAMTGGSAHYGGYAEELEAIAGGDATTPP